MAQNFGSNFLKSFQPTFARSFNTSYRYGLDQQEEERKRKEELKAQKEQQGILSQLMRGTKNIPIGKRVSQVPLTKEEQFLDYSKLSPQNQNAYEWWKKQNAPKQDEYYAPNLSKDLPTIGRWNKTKGTWEDTGQPNPLYKEDIPSTFEVVPANSIKGYENYPKDYTVQLTKKGDEIISQSPPRSPRQISVNINTGEEYNKLETNTKKFLDNKVEELNNLRALLTHAPNENGDYRIYDKLGQWTGINLKPEQVQKAINDKNAVLGNFISGNFGQAIIDYKRLKIQAETDPKIQGKPMSQKASLWNSVYKEYIKDLKDDKDDAWLEAQKYAFINDYGFNPVEKFHQGLFKKK